MKGLKKGRIIKGVMFFIFMAAAVISCRGESVRKILRCSGERAKGHTIEVVPYRPIRKNIPQELISKRGYYHIVGNQIYKGSKPTFVLGVHVNISPSPYYLKMIGVDWCYHIMSLENFFRLKRKNNHLKVIPSYRAWLDTYLKIISRANLCFWAEVDHPVVGRGFYGARPYRGFEDLLVTNGHFFCWRPDNPDSVKIIEEAMKAAVNTCSGYPILAYELYNEVRYMDYSPYNLKKFRERMRKKYGTISKANAFWGTHFSSFEEVFPPMLPRYLTSACGMSCYLPKNFSRRLWRDWVRFTEDRFAEIAAWTSNLLHKLSPEPYTYTTIQIHSLFPTDYYSCGVNPEKVNPYLDIACPEIRWWTIKQRAGEEVESEIIEMIKSSMICDIIRHSARNKPIIDGELHFKTFLSKNPPEKYMDLAGEWKFCVGAQDDGKKGKWPKGIEQDRGEREGWYKPNYDDSSWETVKIPHRWGEKYPHAFIGWYRRKFFVPLKIKNLYLHGKELADRATIFVNGVKVYDTHHWNENFHIDISPYIRSGEENILAIRIYNKHFAGKHYWGRFIGPICLTIKPFCRDATPGALRALFWERLAHGYSGLFLWPHPALPCFSPEALKTLPLIKKQMDGIGDIVYPRPRIKGEIGLLYSYPSFRGRIPKDSADRVMTSELARVYASLIFNQYPVDVITEEDIFNGKIRKYKAIVIACARRSIQGISGKLDKYVKEGGILIIFNNSLVVDDEWETKIKTPKCLGIERGVIIRKKKIIEKSAFLRKSETIFKKSIEGYGESFILRGGKALIRYKDLSPAVSENQYGRGYAYFIGPELCLHDLRMLISSILRRRGLYPEININAKREHFVESHLLGKGYNRRVLLLVNFGGDIEIKINLKNFPCGKYQIIDVSSGEIISAPDGKSFWNLSNQSIRCSIPTVDARVFLIRKVIGEKPLPVPKLNLSKNHSAMLKQALEKSPPGKWKVLFDAQGAEYATPRKAFTLKRLLEAYGFEVYTGIGHLGDKIKVLEENKRLPLSSFDIIVIGGKGGIGLQQVPLETASWWNNPEDKRILMEKIKEGTSVIFGGVSLRAPGGANPRLINYLLTDLGIKIAWNILYDPEPDYKKFGHFSIQVVPNLNHPISVGSQRLENWWGMPALKIRKNSGWQILAYAREKSYPVNSWLEPKGSRKEFLYENKVPVSAILEKEEWKGKVVVIGDVSMWLPSELKLADNAQWTINLFRYLVGEKPKKDSKKKLKDLCKYLLF